jgi:hypothetical protein
MSKKKFGLFCCLDVGLLFSVVYNKILISNHAETHAVVTSDGQSDKNQFGHTFLKCKPGRNMPKISVGEYGGYGVWNRIY